MVRAEGEAQAAKMITDACKDNPAYIALRRLEVCWFVSFVYIFFLGEIFKCVGVLQYFGPCVC